MLTQVFAGTSLDEYQFNLLAAGQGGLFAGLDEFEGGQGTPQRTLTVGHDRHIVVIAGHTPQGAVVIEGRRIVTRSIGGVGSNFT